MAQLKFSSRIVNSPPGAARHAGAEGDVGAFRVVWQRLRAVPDARVTVDAFLTVAHRYATITGRDGLAGANIGGIKARGTQPLRARRPGWPDLRWAADD